ncbi:hypothetical protein BJF92_09490 [Rhizobium rhizosphaerae]|uniref:DUF992 domain-containing protein n=1 Tax=Xaviernesmea rhizosphaerae TaxID=1672749 RepID=A0A1Q9AG81_9HYPH|nr:DUF992 domain-containing protein [Xaviernesmea rhizosphaerae]OLP53973.1 hypothetical protein BJF92_09490 [Xaviernesmea rhizosphaerae]OQP86100.1 hypothetical protein BTR14_11940 [Xaviernesmea rhizosphaerae]
MRKKLTTVLALAGALVGANAVSAADMIEAAPTYQDTDSRDGVKIGMLSCNVGGGVGYVIGSAKSVDCVFTSTRGTTDRYTGTIRKMGVDLGFTTQGRIVWAVFAPTAGYHRGSLGGLYQGATAEVTVFAGVGANVLVGGTAGSIQLQTVSIGGQLGLNLAATGTSVTLTPAG